MNKVQEKIISVLAQVTRKDPSEINLLSRLNEDLSLDSLDYLELNYELEKYISLVLEPEDLMDVINVQDICDVIELKSKDVKCDKSLK